MNFSKIDYRGRLGRVLRLPLKLIPKGMVLPILQGRMKGMKWVVGAGEHGYWLGSYEIRKRLAFEHEIAPESVVYDIGANVGYYSLMASVLAGPKGYVYAFEPLPRNIRYLNRHVSINQIKNITVLEAAVAGQTGEAYFNTGASTSMGHLANSGEIKVRQVSLDDLLNAGQIQPPDYMKVDVEGAEYEALCGARALINEHRPVIFLDTHQRSAHQKTADFLKTCDYDIEILDGKSIGDSKEIIARPKS